MKTSFVVPALLLATHFFLLSYSAFQHSPIVDEFGHLPAGLSHWELGDFSLFRANPPLARMVAAAPLLLTPVQTDWHRLDDSTGVRAEFMVGRDFLNVNGPPALNYFILARMACVPFSLLAGFVVFLWARELYGPVSGMAACALWCFSPMVLAFGSTIMPDVGSAAMGILAAYSYWQWLRCPTYSRAVAAGMLLGAALLTKFTWLILFLVWPVCLIVWLLLAETKGSVAGLLQKAVSLILICTVGVWIVNIGYGFESTGKKLGNFTFVSHWLRGEDSKEEIGAHQFGNVFANTFVADLPVLLPAQFVHGLDIQKRDHEEGMPSYLRGEWRDRGWWYYYLYALLVKVPMGTLLITILIAILPNAFSGYDKEKLCAELLLWLHIGAVLLLVSSQNGISHHPRLVLPAFPFVFIWLSKIFSRRTRKPVLLLALICLTWSISSSLWCFPHSLSYFNELAGGPLGGHNHLLGSNIDWGQDLFYLQSWIKNHPECKEIGLATYGRVDPAFVGIKHELPPNGPISSAGLAKQNQEVRGPLPGWYIISINYLLGDLGPVFDGNGRQKVVDGPLFTYFNLFDPVDSVGYSLYVYHLSEADVQRFTKRQGLPKSEQDAAPKR